MELILYLLFLAISLLILYHIIRVAVREGVSEALNRQEQNRANQK
ncbi:MAG: hypothetical protein AB7E30_02645 [Lawsonibacter sp.]